MNRRDMLLGMACAVAMPIVVDEETVLITGLAWENLSEQDRHSYKFHRVHPNFNVDAAYFSRV